MRGRRPKRSRGPNSRRKKRPNYLANPLRDRMVRGTRAVVSDWGLRAWLKGFRTRPWSFEAGATSQATCGAARERTRGGLTGVSVACATGVSVEELAELIPHGQVGVTTVAAVRAAGGEVMRTSGRSPHHATMAGLSPDEASRLLTPTMANPARKRGRKETDHG